MAGRGRAVGGGAGGGRRSGAAPTGGGRAGGAPNAEPLYVLAVGDGLIRPCVDCGRQTGNFCETLLQAGHAFWQGGVCLAADWMPQEEWAEDPAVHELRGAVRRLPVLPRSADVYPTQLGPRWPRPGGRAARV